VTLSLAPASAGQGPLGPGRRFDWRTPQAFFNRLDREFGFQLDACADAPLRPDLRFFGHDLDGLMRDWRPGPVFLNPPYGREISAWMQLAAYFRDFGVTTVALVPARLDTRWWHQWVMPFASEVRCVRSRLQFDDVRDSRPPFASVVVIFCAGRSGPPCLSVQP
jgi:site-specific DNA-methyltransferase (adenine-specific)